LNQDEARQLGLSSAAVAEFINAAVTGIPATQVRDSIYLIDVVAQAEASERISLETIRPQRWRAGGDRRGRPRGLSKGYQTTVRNPTPWTKTAGVGPAVLGNVKKVPNGRAQGPVPGEIAFRDFPFRLKKSVK
jgi:hypothetical protein